MGWREYLHLFEKYEGELELATERELEHAGRGRDPETARLLAELDYKRKERTKKNEQNQQNNQNVTQSVIRDNRCGDCLF